MTTKIILSIGTTLILLFSGCSDSKEQYQADLKEATADCWAAELKGDKDKMKECRELQKEFDERKAALKENGKW